MGWIALALFVAAMFAGIWLFVKWEYTSTIRRLRDHYNEKMKDGQKYPQ